MKNFYKLQSGHIVLMHFPFTDLSAKKVRPALIITSGKDQDALVAPISTTINSSRDDITLKASDYKDQPLPVASCVRYTKLFTLNKNLILKKVSELKQNNTLKIKQKIVKYINS